MTPFFKNLLIYRFTRDIALDAEKLEEQLNEFWFVPCGSQDLHRIGWVPPMGKHGDMLTHVINDCIFICAQKEEKLIDVQKIPRKILLLSLFVTHQK